MKDNRNLGRYNLKTLLRNPGLIHRIQDNFAANTHPGIFGQTLRDNAVSDIGGCIRMVADQYQDNSKLVTEVVGRETIKLMCEYLGIDLADDFKSLKLFEQ